MFDELARRGNGYTDHVVLPTVLQKRLSLVSHRGSIFGQFCPEMAKNQQEDTMTDQPGVESIVEVVVAGEVAQGKGSNVYETLESSQQEDRTDCTIEEKPYRRESNGLTPLRYNRRCRNADRPLSGSSVASSTSSSGCSNQGNTCNVNPYLASVESLADTCASSQGKSFGSEFELKIPTEIFRGCWILIVRNYGAA